MVRGLLLAVLVRTDNAAGEQLPIPRRHPASPRVPLLETIGLHAQHGGLQIIETRRLAGDGVLVLARSAVVAKQLERRGERVVVRRDETRVAERAEILGGVKAETAGGRERSRTA